MNRTIITLLAGVAALGFASSTYAADLIVEAPAAPVVAVSGNWDGPYLGVFAGYAAADMEDGGVTYDIDGWLLGVNAGVNFTLTDGVVAGVVGDIAWSGQEGDGVPIDIDWSGSVRGLVGFDGGSFLPYLTAGLAFAHVDVAGDDATQVGWTAGVGVKFAVSEDLSLDAQYRYSDYGDHTYAGPGDTSLTSHQVTVGLNWSF